MKKNNQQIKEANLNYFTQSFKDDSFVAWVAVIKGEIVATSGICFYETPPNAKSLSGKVGYIQNMYTKKEYRRREIAKKLLENTVEEAKTRGCGKVILGATDMGRAMYEKFGFEEMKDEMVFYI